MQFAVEIIGMQYTVYSTVEYTDGSKDHRQFVTNNHKEFIDYIAKLSKVANQQTRLQKRQRRVGQI